MLATLSSPLAIPPDKSPLTLVFLGHFTLPTSYNHYPSPSKYFTSGAISLTNHCWRRNTYNLIHTFLSLYHYFLFHDIPYAALLRRMFIRFVLFLLAQAFLISFLFFFFSIMIKCFSFLNFSHFCLSSTPLHLSPRPRQHCTVLKRCLLPDDTPSFFLNDPTIHEKVS